MSPEGRDPSPRPEASFDERLARLESIVGELEGGKLGLEPAIARYQEGVELLKDCQRKLAGLRARVLELGREAEGALTPFDGDPDAGARP
jgi:exodeoxyribonuclease VII small subunit